MEEEEVEGEEEEMVLAPEEVKKEEEEKEERPKTLYELLQKIAKAQKDRKKQTLWDEMLAK